MSETFKDYVLKYTRGELYKYVKSDETFTSRNSKAKIMNYLYSKEVSKEVIDDFKKVWEEYRMVKV